MEVLIDGDIGHTVTYTKAKETGCCMAGRARRVRHDRLKDTEPRTTTTRLIKGIVLCTVAVIALAAGIYKGREGLFFGVVFALACGLLGILYIKRD